MNHRLGVDFAGRKDLPQYPVRGGAIQQRVRITSAVA